MRAAVEAIPRTRRDLAADAVIFVGQSADAKIGAAAATYAPVRATCPATCPLRKPDPETGREPCYVLAPGRVGMHERRISKAADAARLTPREVAQAEADAIDRGRPTGLPLRLHVSGDARTSTAARILAGAAARYTKRNGGAPVWTYSHAWRAVPRDAWGSVSVLASADSPADAAAADAAGYAVALTVPDLASTAGRPIPGTRLRGVACRYDLAGVPCSACRLCFDAERLQRERLAILFPLKRGRRAGGAS